MRLAANETGCGNDCARGDDPDGVLVRTAVEKIAGIARMIVV